MKGEQGAEAGSNWHPEAFGVLGPSPFSSCSSKVSRAPVPGAVWEGSLQEVAWRWELEDSPSQLWLVACRLSR